MRKNQGNFILKNISSQDEMINYLKFSIGKHYDLKLIIDNNKFTIEPNYSLFSKSSYVTLNGNIEKVDNYYGLQYKYTYKNILYIPAIIIFVWGELVTTLFAIDELNYEIVIVALLFFILPIIYSLMLNASMKYEYNIINKYINFLQENSKI